tara:strand:- start:1207 stop:2040 length:834 start_codon:yes stop_codon:yes gene_type:complete
MKQNKLMTMLFLLGFFISYNGISQSLIEYGSTNGNYIEINNTKIYYEEYGEGTTTVLMLHGGFGSISNFQHVIPELSKHFKLIAIDSPSHGRSQHIDSLSYQILADYMVALIDTLKLPEVNIIGYSDGAIIGMLIAHKRPGKVNKLVFGAGALNPKASKPEGLKMLQATSPEILPKEFEIAYKSKSPNPENWEQFVYDSKAMWLQEVWIPQEILPQIKSKTLILFGDRDPFIPLSHALAIYDTLPNSQLFVLPKTHHNIFDNPKLVNPILIDFLTQN